MEWLNELLMPFMDFIAMIKSFIMMIVDSFTGIFDKIDEIKEVISK